MPSFNNFKDLEKAIKKKLEQASGEVSVTELLTEGFMQTNTKYQDAKEFFDNVPFKAETQEEWDAIDSSVKDAYVSEVTNFDTWDQMIQKAGQEYFAKKLKL